MCLVIIKTDYLGRKFFVEQKVKQLLFEAVSKAVKSDWNWSIFIENPVFSKLKGFRQVTLALGTFVFWSIKWECNSISLSRLFLVLPHNHSLCLPIFLSLLGDDLCGADRQPAASYLIPMGSTEEQKIWGKWDIGTHDSVSLPIRSQRHSCWPTQTINSVKGSSPVTTATSWTKLRIPSPFPSSRPRGGNTWAITQSLKKVKIKCSRCTRGFTTENQLQFHEHIPCLSRLWSQL